jgi:hypothetical protein
MSQIDITIIIVSWNTKELVRACLHSIYKFIASIPLQVIVIDNLSQDGSVEMVRTEFPHVQLIEAGDNLGFGRANNLGLRQAQGRYVLFLNSDTLFIDSSLIRCMQFADEHPDAGFIGCRLLNADGSFQKGSFMTPGLFATLFINLGLYIFFPASLKRSCFLCDRDYDRNQIIDWMCGAFMLIDRTKLEQIGYFDERLFMYSEDLDLCLRAKQARWHNYYFADARIIHYGNQSAQYLFGDRRLQAVFRSLVYVYRKHFGVSYTRRYLVILTGTSWLKTLHYCIKSAWTHKEIDRQQYQLQRNIYEVCREQLKIDRS